MNWIDWIGYLAAALIVMSFLVQNLRVLRIINLLGALAFMVYGFLLDVNLPIIIPNGFIVCIQVFYLFIKKAKA